MDTCILQTPLGPMRAAAENGALTGLWFIPQKYQPTGVENWKENPDHPVFAALREHLNGYFAGKREDAPILLAPRGTDFQRLIWGILLQIPYGETTTYGEISTLAAEFLGVSSMSAQAVGGAVGHNPISILIPCHRVVGKAGAWTGYAGGLDKKRALLKIEGIRLA
jgi:methylated-DNA-[protein]-cysteine S-methyltransferase